MLSHGEQTARSIVLFHGLTACPFQYHELAQLYFDEGYNVYVPRLPYHGYVDRTGNHLADLTAENLFAVMDPALDLAAGLGDEVTMAGLSLGGNVAAAGGQLRADLRLAATHMVHTAAGVVDRMFTLAGGDAVFAASPLQRALRDIHVATQHMMVAEPTFELVGRLHLGLPTQVAML